MSRQHIVAETVIANSIIASGPAGRVTSSDIFADDIVASNGMTANVFTANTVVFRDGTSQNTAFGFCGSFERSTDQYSAGATSSNVVSFDITSTSKGVTLDNASNTQITFSVPGDYFIQFYGQFYHLGKGDTVIISTWYTKNGGNSGLSHTYSDEVANGSLKQILGTVSDIITVSTPGDYVQFYWWSDDVDVIMIATPAGSNPTRPYSPSAKVNVYKVG